ncbi:MAG TPA: YrdB family protein [Actinomycetota bacterium]|nr:YrdB family protein [Actinomycetota bacterium]
MSGLRGLVLTLRFLCELGMLTALMVWGFHVGDGAWAFVLGIGAPAVAATVWGVFVAPKAAWPVRLALRVSIEIDLFVISAVALWFAGYPAWAVALAALGIGTSLANAWQEGRGEVVP